MAEHRLYGKTDNMIDNRHTSHTTSQSGQILTRQHFLLLVYKIIFSTNNRKGTVTHILNY